MFTTNYSIYFRSHLTRSTTPISCGSNLWPWYITQMENHKQLISRQLSRFDTIYNILEGYMIITIKGRDIWLLQFIKIYILSRTFPCLHVSWYTPDAEIAESREAEKTYFGRSTDSTFARVTARFSLVLSVPTRQAIRT